MAWLKERHYLRSTPPGYVAVLEFLDGRDRVGAMMLGRPSARKLDQSRVLSLNRMYFVDEAPKNTESHALALMRKFVRTWLPGVRLLIAYSDPAQGHTGTVYEADGWARLLVFRLLPLVFGFDRMRRRNGPHTFAGELADALVLIEPFAFRA